MTDDEFFADRYERTRQFREKWKASFATHLAADGGACQQK